jgi:hypothetical protein
VILTITFRYTYVLNVVFGASIYRGNKMFSIPQQVTRLIYFWQQLVTGPFSEPNIITTIIIIIIIITAIGLIPGGSGEFYMYTK